MSLNTCIIKSCVWLSFLLALTTSAADDTVIDVIPLTNRPASELQPLLTPMLESGDRIGDDGYNLIVRTNKNRLENIKHLVQQLDRRSTDLLVTVLQNSYKTAAELNSNDRSWSSRVQMRGMNADTRDIINSENMQTLRTLDGQSAYIQTGKVKLIQNTNSFGMYNSNLNTTGVNAQLSPQQAPAVALNNLHLGSINSQIYSVGANAQVPVASVNDQELLPIGASLNTQTTETSTGFTITPHLNDEQVLIDVAPWSEHFQQNGDIDTQSARTFIRAKLGEWVQIAGNDSGERSSSEGLKAFNHTTYQSSLRILVKVDKVN